MTGRTTRIQTEVSLGEVFLSESELLAIPIEVGLVAGTARRLRMLSLKRVACKLVIETLFTGLPVDQVEITPMVFHVAVLTFPILGLRVQPASAIDARLHLGVTAETLAVHLIRIPIMALVAVLDTVQKGVGTMQIARRQLRVRSLAECGHHDKSDDLCQPARHDEDQDIQP